MTPGILSVTIGGGTGGAMGVGGKIGFITSVDTTGDVVTDEVGVPGNCIGFDIGAIWTTGAGTGTCVVWGTTVSCCPVGLSLATVIGCVAEATIGTRT
jgi:hypothetical protein